MRKDAVQSFPLLVAKTVLPNANAFRSQKPFFVTALPAGLSVDKGESEFLSPSLHSIPAGVAALHSNQLISLYGKVIRCNLTETEIKLFTEAILTFSKHS